MYQLVYFPIRGRAEHIRLFFEDLKIPYESKVITFEEWGKYKPEHSGTKELPFGQLPVLRDDQLYLSQSGAIARHLARKHDKYGKTEEEKALNDMLYDMTVDIHSIYLKHIYDPNRKDKMDTFVQEAKGKLELVEKFVQRRTKSQYLVCDEPTLADYYMYEVLDILAREVKTILESYPKLQAIHAQMKSRPNIAAYLKSERRFDKPVPVSDS
ncbi:hypothetical protein GAYE_PCTG14G0581 [Galdieria yellowstonensis]|uniref:glutathione transferase n=1 Tax=Galdieria yellowstonensis TaxID=3028027 RepID=A0AAV9I2V5_9RHOD|nr:hypothetical protein GAYE_PCTG14G0581 [Galdieria yellowstonensis]